MDSRDDFESVAQSALSQAAPAPDSDRAQQRLYKMIDYAKDRYHWYEDQREKKLSLAISMIALSGISIGIITSSTKTGGIDTNSIQFKIASATLIFVITTALGTIFIYFKGQNLSYTHRKGLTKIFSWYGYGVPKPPEVGVGEFIIFGQYSDLVIEAENSKLTELKKNNVINGFKQFVSAVVPGLQNSNFAYSEDLQQVYALQIFQNIARDNLRAMISWLRIGAWLIGTSSFALAMLIYLHGIPVKG